VGLELDLHKTDDGCNLDDGEDEFRLSVAPNAEEVDADDEDEENRHPCTRIDVFGTLPKRDGNRRRHNFQRQGDEPREGIAVRRRSAPRSTSWHGESGGMSPHFQAMANPHAGSINRVE